MQALAQAQPHDQIEVWATDEHRIGLKPILRRVWARRGQRPPAGVRPRSQWFYVYAFVCPATGQTYWWLMPSVRTDVFRQALAAFAAAVGAGNGKQVVLVLDRAGWHTSAQVTLPPGVQLEWLPSYSPELQPAERLWPLTNEPLANRTFRDLDELEEVQGRRCVALQALTHIVRSLTFYHWWPPNRAAASV